MWSFLMAITSPHTIRQLCPELHAAVIITRRPEAERKSLPSLEGWDIGFSMFLSAESRTFTKENMPCGPCRATPATRPAEPSNTKPLRLYLHGMLEGLSCKAAAYPPRPLGLKSAIQMSSAFVQQQGWVQLVSNTLWLEVANAVNMCEPWAHFRPTAKISPVSPEVITTLMLIELLRPSLLKLTSQPYANR